MTYQSLIEHHAYHRMSWDDLEHNQKSLLLAQLLREHTNLDWFIDKQKPLDFHDLISDCIERPDTVRTASLASELIGMVWNAFRAEVIKDLNEAIAERNRALREPDVDFLIDIAKFDNTAA